MNCDLHSNMVRFIILTLNLEKLGLIDLHSNMVRFIIYNTFIFYFYYIAIYIPIWLDLLLAKKETQGALVPVFTFQYG